jgi:hypothetical protein
MNKQDCALSNTTSIHFFFIPLTFDMMFDHSSYSKIYIIIIYFFIICFSIIKDTWSIVHALLHSHKFSWIRQMLKRWVKSQRCQIVVWAVMSSCSGTSVWAVTDPCLVRARAVRGQRHLGAYGLLHVDFWIFILFFKIIFALAFEILSREYSRWHSVSVDAKIPPDGSSRSTYARVGEICFTPSTEPDRRVCGALGVPINLTYNWQGE